MPRNQGHRQWLDKLLDWYALKSVATLGSAMYSEELAEQVATHFEDPVDFTETVLEGQDLVPDDEGEDDE